MFLRSNWVFLTDGKYGTAALSATLKREFATDVLVDKMQIELERPADDRWFSLLFESGKRVCERGVRLEAFNSFCGIRGDPVVTFSFSGWHGSDDIGVVWSHYRKQLCAGGAALE